MLGLSPILVMLGLVAGLARGGKVSNISLDRFRRPWLVMLGLILQAGGTVFAISNPVPGKSVYVWLLGASLALLIMFSAANIRLPGMPIIIAGLLLNVIAILANNGMPVSGRAARIAGLRPSDYLDLGVKHHAMGPHTVVPFLGDVIPLPVLKKVISIGDVLVGAGMFVLVEGLVRYVPRRQNR